MNRPADPSPELSTDDSVPENAACKTCQYSELTAPTPSLERTRICRRFPPVVVAVPRVDQQGRLVGFAFNTTQPPVVDSHWCYEYDARENGDDEIEPTGLVIPGN